MVSVGVLVILLSFLFFPQANVLKLYFLYINLKGKVHRFMKVGFLFNIYMCGP